MRTPRFLLLVLALVSVTTAAHGATRLVYSMSGAPTAVWWGKESFPIAYSVDQRVVDAFKGSQTTLDRAFEAWSSVPDAEVSFRNAGVVQGASLQQDNRNAIMLEDDLFAQQGIIANTVSWWDTRNGRLIEADIQLDPTLMSGNYNVQQALEHEVGHLLGLDHSAVISSVMYPYVCRGGSAALDSDDRIAIASLYPKAPVGATLQGRVIGNDGGVFAAQVVALNATGQPVATGLTNANGDFELKGLPAGGYRVYAEPLDGPVDPRNLTGVWRQAKVTSFPTQFAESTSRTVEDGRIYGNLVINTSGAPVTLNPRWIGLSTEGDRNFSLGSNVVSLRPGQTMAIAVGGDGFTSGMTKFDVLNPGVKRISDFQYASNYTFATFRVSADAPPGSAVIMVHSGNDTATLTGALRVEGSGAPGRTRVAMK